VNGRLLLQLGDLGFVETDLVVDAHCWVGGLLWLLRQLKVLSLSMAVVLTQTVEACSLMLGDRHVLAQRDTCSQLARWAVHLFEGRRQEVAWLPR